MRDDLTKNHFELFGLPAEFDVDNADLASRYRELQRRFHPDRVAGASDQERRLSVQLTAQINEAFQILKDPLKRGRYLLALAGIETDEDTDTVMEPAFLMEQMELREQLEAIRERPNAHEQLAKMGQDIAQRRKARLDQLKQHLASDENGAYQTARNVLREMQFLEKLAHEIEALEEELI